MLDFGCGAGRTLRHFVGEAQSCEMWGCDIHEPSVAWLEDHLCPPLQVFANGEEPPVPHPDGAFDLIWAVSVFTHLTDAWSRWLLELHRILADDGLIYVTFMGSGMSESIAGEPWEESRYGMNVLRSGQSWDLGGPMVLHSPWWIRAHWGRAFETLTLKPDGFAGAPGEGHGAVLMRKRQVDITPPELEAIEPGEPREATALGHNVRQLREEVVDLREEVVDLRDEGADLRRLYASQQRDLAAGEARTAHLQRELVDCTRRHEELHVRTTDLERQLAVITGSRSWAMTRPLRNFVSVARRRR